MNLRNLCSVPLNDVLAQGSKWVSIIQPVQGEPSGGLQFLQATSLSAGHQPSFFTTADNESGRAIFKSPLLRRYDQSSSLGLVSCYVFSLTAGAVSNPNGLPLENKLRY